MFCLKEVQKQVLPKEWKKLSSVLSRKNVLFPSFGIKKLDVSRSVPPKAAKARAGAVVWCRKELQALPLSVLAPRTPDFSTLWPLELCFTFLIRALLGHY